MVALSDNIQGQQPQRHQRIAEEIRHFQHHTEAGARGAGSPRRSRHQPAVKVHQVLFDAVVRSLEKLARLPVRHQEEPSGKPIAQNGDIQRRQETGRRARQRHHHPRHERQQRDRPAPAEGQWMTRKKRLDPGRSRQDDGKPNLDPFRSAHPLLAGRRCFCSRVAHPPDGVRAVVGDQQRSIFGHGDADRPTPHLAAGENEAGEEVFIFSCSLAALHGKGDHFIAAARIPVPRTMLGREGPAVIRGREWQTPHRTAARAKRSGD